MRDLIIAGAGPAGLAASAYAIRKRLDVLVVSPDVGGKTNYPFSLPWMDEYQVIRGKEVVAGFKRELEYIQFAHLRDTVKQVDAGADSLVVHTGSGTSEECHALIVATGAGRVPLDVPGERKYLSRGLGYSAISYSHLFIDRTVLLIGNGPRLLASALDVALHAASVIVILEPNGSFEADDLQLIESNERITVLRDCTISEFKGKEFAEEAVVRFPDNRTETFRADGFFIEREPIPVSLAVAELVTLDDHGRIVVDMDNRTSHPGVFAAGDVTIVRREQVLVSLGEGTKAALSAYDYLLNRKRPG